MCSQKTDPWQFLMNEKERSFFFFQWVIYRKFYFEDFGKNVERCVTWKWPVLFPYTFENER